MRKTVHVTQKNIDKGLPGSPTRCMVALALNCAGYADVSVTQEGWRNYTGGIVYAPRPQIPWLNPVFMDSVISAHDRSQPVMPFSFEIEVPES